MRWSVLAVLCWTAMTACGNSSGPDLDVDVATIAGTYPIQQVDGHAIPWYHDMGALNCQIAFLTGNLEIAVENRYFLLGLDYRFRCVDSGDGAARLFITGSVQGRDDNMYVLRGQGTSFLNPQAGFERWTLEVTPNGDHVTVRLGGQHRTYFADPVLTMGPRAALFAR